MAVRRLPREPGRRRAGDGLDGPRAREGHHDPRQEHGRPPRGREAEHRRHARPRRLRRRGGAGTDDGRRRAAAGRRLRGPAAADPLRAAQGARGPAARDPRREQGRPARRADRGGGGRGLRAVPGPRRRRAADRVPDRLHQRAGRLGLARGGRGGGGPGAAVRAAPVPHPRTLLRGGPSAPGPRHEPRRVAVRRPPRAVPGPAGHDPRRPADRLVPGRRPRGAGDGQRAVRHRGARPGGGARRRGRARSSRSPASPTSRSGRRLPIPRIPGRCR